MGSTTMGFAHGKLALYLEIATFRSRCASKHILRMMAAGARTVSSASMSSVRAKGAIRQQERAVPQLARKLAATSTRMAVAVGMSVTRHRSALGQSVDARQRIVESRLQIPSPS